MDETNQPSGNGPSSQGPPSTQPPAHGSSQQSSSTQHNSPTHPGAHQGAHAQHQNAQQIHHQQHQQSKPASQSFSTGEPRGLGKLGGMFDDFIKQSERVINVTHKPGRDEFKQIALSTAIGMAVVGIIGYVIAMSAFFIRTAFSA